MEKETKETLEYVWKLAKPLMDYLETNHHPYCSIVIDSNGVKLVENIMFIPTTGLKGETNK